MLGTRHRVPVWGVSIAILMVVIAAIFVVDRINDYAKDHIRAQVILFSIEEDAAEEYIAADHALHDKKTTRRIGEDVAENRRELAEALVELRELDSEDDRLARVRESLGAYEAAIEEELRLIEVGRFEQAQTVAEQQVEPRFEALHEVLEDTSAQYDDAAQRAALVVDVATYTAALLAAIMVIAITRYWQREQARRSEQEALRKSEKRFRALVQNASDIVLVLGTDGIVRYISPAVEKVLGHKPEDVMGKDGFFAAHPDDMPRVQNFVAEVVRNQGTTLTIELRLKHADGSWRYIESRCTSLLDDPTVGGIVINSRDVTERRKAEEELRRSESELATAQRIAHVGNWSFDVRRDEARWSDEMYRISGFAPQEFAVTYKKFLSMVHPEDRELVRGAVREALYDGQDQHSLNYRIVRPDGETRFLHAHYEIVREASGRPTKLIGTVHDVTELKWAEETLQESERKYRTLVEQIPATTYIEALDEGDGVDHTLVYVSPQVEATLGYSPQEWLSDPDLWEELLHPDDRERVLEEDRCTERTGEPFSVEYRIFAKDGRVVWLHDEAVLVRDDSGRPLFWQGVQMDITERRQAEEKLRKSEASLAEAQRLAHLGSWELDLNTREVCWSDESYRIFGFAPGEVEITQDRFMELVHPDDRERLWAVFGEMLAEEKGYSTEFRAIRRDGAERVIHTTGQVVRDEAGKPIKIVGTNHDVTERKALEEQLEHQATHDPLTGLPNRTLLMERLGQALARQSLTSAGRRGGKKPAVLFLDLDDLKVINDSLGHEMGDRMLVSVGRRLRALLRPEDTVARFGGDEFVIVLKESDAEEAGRIAQRLVERMRTFFAVEGRELTITCSVGIALGGGSAGEQPADLLRRADMALYAAKEKGKNRYEVFEAAMEARALERMETEHVLRKTTEREDGFVVHYQPVISLKEGGRIVGFEALVRWNHPWRGLLLPEEFIPLAEETGVIVGIGHWVLKEACRQAHKWHERYPSEQPLTVSVNLSARQLSHPGLVEDVASVLKRSALLEAQDLILEVTESAVMGDMEASVAVLGRLKDLGVRIALDDFGKDHSSLSYLKRLPVDILKIERSFIDGLGTDREDEGIVKAVIELARTLGLEVVAEGVESGEQLEHLREVGCDLAQGFYFWRPVPAERADELLATYNYS